MRLYDINEEAIGKARATLERLQGRYQKDIKATPQQTAEALGRLQYFTDLAEAVKGTDLVIEGIPERLNIKQSFYNQAQHGRDGQRLFSGLQGESSWPVPNIGTSFSKLLG